jgi:hypothetical protein
VRKKREANKRKSEKIIGKDREGEKKEEKKDMAKWNFPVEG